MSKIDKYETQDIYSISVLDGIMITTTNVFINIYKYENDNYVLKNKYRNLGNSTNPSSIAIAKMANGVDYIVGIIDSTDLSVNMYTLKNNFDLVFNSNTRLVYFNNGSFSNTSIIDKTISMIFRDNFLYIYEIIIASTLKWTLLSTIYATEQKINYFHDFSKINLPISTNNKCTITFNQSYIIVSVLNYIEIFSQLSERWNSTIKIDNLCPKFATVIAIDNVSGPLGPSGPTYFNFITYESSNSFNIFNIPTNPSSSFFSDFIETGPTGPTIKVNTIDIPNKTISLDLIFSENTDNVFKEIGIVKTYIQIYDNNSNIIIDGFTTSCVHYKYSDSGIIKTYYKIEINYSSNTTNTTNPVNNVKIKVIRRNKILEDVPINNNYNIPEISTDPTFTTTKQSILLNDGFYISGDESTALINVFLNDADYTCTIVKKIDNLKPFDYKRPIKVDNYDTPEYLGSEKLSDAVDNIINGSLAVFTKQNYVYENYSSNDLWRCISNNNMESNFNADNIGELKIISLTQTTENVIFAVGYNNGKYKLYSKYKLDETWSIVNTTTELKSITYNITDNGFYGIGTNGKLYFATVKENMLSDFILETFNNNTINNYNDMNNVEFINITSSSTHIYLVGLNINKVKELYQYEVNTNSAEISLLIKESPFDGDLYFERIVEKSIYKLKEEAEISLTQEQISYFTSEQIPFFTSDQIKLFTKDHIKAFNPSQIKAFTIEQFPIFSKEQIQVLDQPQIQNLMSNQLNAINMNNFLLSQVELMSVDQIQSLNDDRIIQLEMNDNIIDKCSVSQIKLLTQSQINKLSPAKINYIIGPSGPSLTTNQLNLNPEQITGINDIQRLLLIIDIYNLTTTQIRALTTTQIRALTTTQIQALTTTQIQTLINSLTTQMQDLSTVQIRALSTAQIRALSTAQIRALTLSQLQALYDRQLEAITDTQFNALTYLEIKNKITRIRNAK